MERNPIKDHDETISVSSSIFSKDGTSTRERLTQKLAEVELARKHNEASSKIIVGTSSRTRERLAEVEKELAKSRLRTSTRTREQLALAEDELARLNMATSSRTRERMANIESEIKKGKDRRTSTVTLEIFRKKQELLERMLKKNASVDIAFLVDCTGSMSSYIEETKNDIQGIVTHILNKFENQVKLAFVGYRDHSDGPLRIESLGFTEDVEQFKLFVSRINASGGGDTPEDVLGGLEAAINLTWSSNNKIIIHIGDAPQHGARFHDLDPGEDWHYGEDPRGLKLEDLINNIKQMKISYYFGKINSSTDKMIREFQRVAGPGVVHIKDMKDPNLLEMVVVESVTATIDFSLKKSVVGLKYSVLDDITERTEDEKTLKDFSISEVEPEDVCMKQENDAKWLECSIPPLSTLADIKHNIGSINHKWTTSTVTRSENPFSEGEQRISYHGYRMLHPYKESIVLKEFKHVGKGRDRREAYIEIMETQAVAAFMAVHFNQISPMGSKEIQFLHVSVMQVYKGDGAPKYYNVEVLLSDYKKKYKKWNNNAGYVHDDIYSSTLDAFSHWTYDVTGGFLIVVDLQGVDREKMYILTDPSINCVEPRFGLTNLGDLGIKMFFKSHSCSDICVAMGLKLNRYMKSSTPARISAAFTKMVGWS